MIVLWGEPHSRLCGGARHVIDRVFNAKFLAESIVIQSTVIDVKGDGRRIYRLYRNAKRA